MDERKWRRINTKVGERYKYFHPDHGKGVFEIVVLAADRAPPMDTWKCIYYDDFRWPSSPNCISNETYNMTIYEPKCKYLKPVWTLIEG